MPTITTLRWGLRVPDPEGRQPAAAPTSRARPRLDRGWRCPGSSGALAGCHGQGGTGRLPYEAAHVPGRDRQSGGPHPTPLWDVWDETALWLYSVVRSQRWTDISRDRRVAVLVNAGDAYGELRGAELRGAVEIVGEVPRTGAPDARLAGPERLYARKYEGTGVMHHTGHTPGCGWSLTRSPAGISGRKSPLGTMISAEKSMKSARPTPRAGSARCRSAAGGWSVANPAWPSWRVPAAWARCGQEALLEIAHGCRGSGCPV